MQSNHEPVVAAPALDGSNPLGFLAALGLLRILDTRHRVSGASCPRLSWRLAGNWQAEFHGPTSIDEIVDAVIEDKQLWADDPAMLLAYDDSGAIVDPRTAPRCTRDLKPAPSALRAYLMRTAEDASDTSVATAPRVARSFDMLAAYASEVVQDNSGKTKPTAFDFTSGQQRFLDAVARLREHVSPDDLREALLGPWSATSALPSMSWDSTVSRNYALRAGDPSKEKRGSTPGADWLAYVGLSLTAAFPRGRRLHSTGVTGGWKNSVFTWPLWTIALNAATVRSVLATADLAGMPVSTRVARGIGGVWACSISREQKGYGVFSPSTVR